MSMEKNVTKTAATTAVTTASTRRVHRQAKRRRVPRGRASGSAGSCGGGDSSVTVPAYPSAWRSSFDNHEQPARLDRRAFGHGDLFDAPRARHRELVLHLHGFDDDEPLAGGDGVAGLDEHAHDATGHRRLHPLLAVAARIARAGALEPAAIDDSGDRQARRLDEALP